MKTLITIFALIVAFVYNGNNKQYLITTDSGYTYQTTSDIQILCQSGTWGVQTGSAVIRFQGQIYTVKWRPNAIYNPHMGFDEPVTPGYGEVRYGGHLWSAVAGGNC